MSDGKAPRGTPWDAALRYLGQRAHSRLELDQKLTRRGYEPKEVRQTLERLDLAGLIDDEQFAIDYARSLFEAKGVSSREVVRRLRERGVGQAIIDSVLATTSDSDFERALRIAERRLSQMQGIDNVTLRRRLLAYLGRRGFSEGVCYAVVRQLA